MRKFVAIGLIVMLVLAGSGAAVYAAHDSLPTAPLYPLKLAGEAVRLGLTRDPEARLGLLLDYVDTRIQEMGRLAGQNESVPERTVARLEAQLGDCLQLAAQQDGAQMAGDLLRIRDRLATQTRLMENAQVQAPADPALAAGLGVMRRTQATVENGLQEPQRFREQVGAGRGVSSSPTAVSPGQGPGPRP